MAIYRKKKFINKKKRAFRKKPITNQIKKVVHNELRKNQEVKVKQTNVMELNTWTTLYGIHVLDMTSLSQGTTRNTRVGNKVRFIGFQWKGYMFNNSTTTSVYVRAMLIQTKNPNDITDTSELFTYGDGTTGSVSTVGANMGLMYQDINKSKYNVLWQKQFVISPSLDEQTRAVKHVYMFKKISLPVWYEANTTGADNQNQRVHLVLLASEPANDVGAGNVIELSYRANSYFIDS